ncbi:site-specific DNA-methyltransferase [Roseomonas alkaliterrae]|uniref:Methyltransferase n=1 Tax=Neoroseomonas alkaliterrae TaxID=1452450 RepID=A0A840XTD1_9PROT|nr:site-specific DNA-methyltransferase [Neoroseomonas alkaliterrae]MBB5691815.1 DNA modification methylase [Neoroseomonas alkaliterrae]MBR0676017.1 site-specific DNA-methyltransferase [Neoroseomonas alkaliterrae]
MPQAPWSASAVKAREVAALLPYAGNARTHSAEQVAQIAASILEFGFVAPVLVDERGELIAGHGRLLAAKSLGLDTVPTIVRAGLTEAQKAAYRLADNRIALNAGWDEALLATEVAKLQEMGGVDLALTGFDGAEIERLLAGLETDAGNLPAPVVASGAEPAPGNQPDADSAEPADDPADATPEPPRQAVARVGDIWLLGEHRLACGDSTNRSTVARVMATDRASLLFTSPPYGNQRDYTTGGVSDWDALMQGVFQHLDGALRRDAQVLVNLGLIHREGEWQPYWQGWLDWMRGQGWRRFGLYAWDQGPGLPGDWNGRLAPAFELVFHFNREARPPNKIVPCKWAGTPNKGSGLRAADGEVKAYTHIGLPVQEMRIPDSVLRITRHKGRGIETEHPAVFPVALPEFLMRAYTDEGDVVFEPFGGSGTTILAGQRTGRRVRAIELAPAYVDLAIARWRMLHPDLPVTLAEDGRDYDSVAAARAEVTADAA